MICEETIKKYCCEHIENIENYEKAISDKTETWDCHHRLETHTPEGIERAVKITQKELKEQGLYYNRPAQELIFIRQAEHKYLHQKGRPLSEEHKKAISIANRNNTETRCNAEMRKKLSEIAKARTVNYFLGKHHTEETKKLLSKNHKGICKNKHGFNNGKIEQMDYVCPVGFEKGRLYHERRK